jgi:lipopolysaccharide transport system permease protein
MVAYLAAIWRCRYFWLSLVKMDLRTRYRGSVLGIGWSLLHPIFMTIILCTVFGRLFATNLTTFAPFLMAGLTFWAYLTATTVQGCHCFFSGEAYIRQYPAPLAIYPLRTALAGGFHFLLALMLVILLGWIMHGYTSIVPLLTLVPTCVLLLVMGWSLAVLFGLANVRFRDTSYLCEVLLQIVFYLTPVMYPPKLLNDKNVGWVIDFNPLVPFLNLLRDPLEKSIVPSWTTFLAAASVTTCLALVACFTLKSQERQLIFHL